MRRRSISGHYSQAGESSEIEQCKKSTESDKIIIIKSLIFWST